MVHCSKKLRNKWYFSTSFYSCKICGKYFTTSFLIYRHMSTHEGHKDFKCGVCGIDNKSNEDLKIHLKTHDPDDMKYSHCCELCGKRYNNFSVLPTIFVTVWKVLEFSVNLKVHHCVLLSERLKMISRKKCF